jgi:thiamine transport system permease protein
VDEHRPALIGRGPWLALAAAPLAFVLLLFGWPLVAILVRGLQEGGALDALSNPGVRSVARFTVVQAAASTALTLVAGMVPAYVLARYRFRGRRAVQALLTVPFVLPTVVVGAAFLALLPSRWHGTVGAILVAHVFFNLAVVVRTVGGLWAQLDPALEDAARTLGASPWRVARYVTLPLLWPAIVAAASIVFLFTFTSFGVVRILGGPRHPTLEVEIYRRFVQLGDLGGAAAIAIVQLVAVAVLLVWWGRSQERHARALRLRPVAVRRRPHGARQWALVVSTCVLSATFVLVPLVRLGERSLWTGASHGVAGWRLLAEREQPGIGAEAPLASLWASLRFAAVAALIATVVGGLAALAIAHGRRAGHLLDTGLMLPLGTSAVTIGFGLVITFDAPPLDLRGSAALIPLGHALIAIPFVVRIALPVLRAIDPGLRDAAATLGASPLSVVRRLDVPIVARPLLAGAAFAFAISMGEFGATSFLTRRGQRTMPVVIDTLLGRPGAVTAAEAYALATVLLAVTLAVVVAFDVLRGDAEGVF